MSRWICVLIIFLLLVSCSSDKAPLQDERKIENIENGLVEFVMGTRDGSVPPQTNMSLSERMAFHKIPGVSIVVIDDNKIAWAKAYGIINAESGVPVTTETFFEAASTTKMIVAAIALRMVEQGHLDLDEDANAYLRSWKIPESDLTREQKVTLRLLLTHQSGLNRPEGGFSCEEGSAPSLVQVLKGEAPALNQGAIIEYVPGTKWQYSNFGYIVVQLILEDVAGKPLTQIAREVVFEPLGMRSSTLAYPLEEELRAKEAVPHDADGKAHNPEMHPTAVAQGGLMTTPSDLALFAIELMSAYQGESGHLLSPEMVRQMFQPVVAIDPAIMGPGLADGLGVFVRGEGEGLVFLHPGDNYPGSSCWLSGNPGAGKGVVIMTNGAKGNLLALEILPAIAKEYNWPDMQ